jgi:hypothetical protein
MFWPFCSRGYADVSALIYYKYLQIPIVIILKESRGKKSFGFGITSGIGRISGLLTVEVLKESRG